MPPLEVPVFSSSSAHLAISAGAHRLELNRANSYPQGGLTPSLSDLEALSSYSTVPLRVMIRPRGPPPPLVGEDDSGSTTTTTTTTPDFIYSDAEMEEMRERIKEFVGSGLLRRERGDGLVFGVLRRILEDKGKAVVVVDVERNRELVRLAGGLACVFHRAFDDILGTQGATPEEALADLHHCGFHGLLTSGGPGSAADHTETLARIVRSAPERIREVIIGGGVRGPNVQVLREALLGGAPPPGTVEVWFHSSCLASPREGDVVDGEELRAILAGLM